MGIFRRGSDTATDTDLLTRPELEEDDVATIASHIM